MKNKIKYSNKEPTENNHNKSQPNIPISDVISKTKLNPNLKNKLEIIGSIKIKQPDFYGEFKEKLGLNDIFNKINKQNFTNKKNINDEKEKYSYKFILYPKKRITNYFFEIKKINKKENIVEKINKYVQTIKFPKKKLKRIKSSSTKSQSNSTLNSLRKISSNILEELKINNNDEKNYLIKKNNTLKNKKIKIKLNPQKKFNSNKITTVSDNFFSLIHEYKKKSYENVSVNTDQEIKKLFLLKNQRLLTYTKETQTEMPKELRLNFIECMPSLFFYSPKANKITKFKDDLIITIINELTIEKTKKNENEEMIKNFSKDGKTKILKTIKINNGFEKIKNSKGYMTGIQVYKNNKEVNIFSNPLKLNKVKKTLKTKTNNTIENKDNINNIEEIKPENCIVKNQSFQIEKENSSLFKIKAGEKMHHLINNYLYRGHTFSKNNISYFSNNSTMSYFALCNSNNNGYGNYKLNKKIQELIHSSIKERRTLNSKNNKSKKMMIGRNVSCGEIIGSKNNSYGLNWTSNTVQKNFENPKIFTNFGTFNNYPLYIKNYSMNKNKKSFNNDYKY